MCLSQSCCVSESIGLCLALGLCDGVTRAMWRGHSGYVTGSLWPRDGVTPAMWPSLSLANDHCTLSDFNISTVVFVNIQIFQFSRINTWTVFVGIWFCLPNIIDVVLLCTKVVILGTVRCIASILHNTISLHRVNTYLTCISVPQL